MFHRWHHTSPHDGGNTNLAGTFPLWDILFGTFRMPENRLPDHYGVEDQVVVPDRDRGATGLSVPEISARATRWWLDPAACYAGHSDAASLTLL